MSEYVCGKGCGRPVKGIYCDPHRAQAQAEIAETRDRKAALARERMADPKFQAKLQAARAAAAAPAREGE